MKVSVIIPALNEEALLAGAAHSAWEAGADEVIVVDGGSVDKTIAVAEARKCQVVISAAGRAIQQNAGAARAVGDILLFLHADSRLSPTAIEQVRRLLSDTDVKFGAFKQQIAARGVAYRVIERGNAWRVRWRGVPYGDQAIFLRREFFESLGGFPEVKLMEDLLLMKKSETNLVAEAARRACAGRRAPLAAAWCDPTDIAKLDIADRVSARLVARQAGELLWPTRR